MKYKMLKYILIIVSYWGAANDLYVGKANDNGKPYLYIKIETTKQ